MKPVDEVVKCIVIDTCVAETIKMIKPSVFAKGGDRDLTNIPEKERDSCRKVKCKIVCGVGGKTHSSSWYDWENLALLQMTINYN